MVGTSNCHFLSLGSVSPHAESVLSWESSKVIICTLGFSDGLLRLYIGLLKIPREMDYKKAIMYKGFDCLQTQRHLAMSGDIFYFPEWGLATGI